MHYVDLPCWRVYLSYSCSADLIVFIEVCVLVYFITEAFIEEQLEFRERLGDASSAGAINMLIF